MSLNATTILGPGGFSRISVDVYDATKTYKAGEYRNHDGIIYKAIVDIDTAEAWNSEHWVVSEPVNESAVKMVTALNAIADAMQPANVYLDLEVSLLASDWTASSPYEYTWVNSHVASECEVEAFFGDGADASVVKYLWYEKVAGGVKFTAPTKPNSNIPVVIRIINAKADFVVSDLTASQIYTEAITGVSNVEEGLENLDERAIGLEDGVAYRLGNTNTTGGTLATGTYIYVDGNVTLSTGMYKASNAISNGDTLSLSNLSPVPGGVANEINSKINKVGETIILAGDKVSGVYLTKLRNAYMVSFRNYSHTVPGTDFDTGLRGLLFNTASLGLKSDGTIVRIICNANAILDGAGYIGFMNATADSFETGAITGQILIV